MEHKDKPEATEKLNSVAEEKQAEKDKKKDKSRNKQKSGEGKKMKSEKRKVGKVETESGMESKTKDPVGDRPTDKDSPQADKVGADIQVDTTVARGSPPPAAQDIGSTVLAEETGQIRKKTKKGGAEKGKGKKGSAELEKAEEKTKSEETNSKDKKPGKKAKKEKEAGDEINSGVRGDVMEGGEELKKRKRDDEVTALDIGKDRRKKKNTKSPGDANTEDVKVKKSTGKDKDKEKKKGKSRTEPVSA